MFKPAAVVVDAGVPTGTWAVITDAPTLSTSVPLTTTPILDDVVAWVA